MTRAICEVSRVNASGVLSVLVEKKVLRLRGDNVVSTDRKWYSHRKRTQGSPKVTQSTATAHPFVFRLSALLMAGSPTNK